jgi:hypothetical protein
MNGFQHSVDLVWWFEVVLLKGAFVLCLKDEYTDSIRLLSPKGLYVVSQAKLLEDPCQP